MAPFQPKPLPEKVATLEVEAVIEAEAFDLIRKGYEPQTQHDKWCILMDEAWVLRIYRSASGSCIFNAQLASHPDGYTITVAQVNRDPTQYRSTDPVYDARLFIYLVRRLLLNHEVPFPHPAGLPHQNKVAHQQHVMGSNPETPPSFIPLNM